MRVLIATDFKMICKGDNLYLKDTTYNTVLRYKKQFGTVTLCTRVYYDGVTEGFVDATGIIDDYIPINNLSDTLIGKNDEIIKSGIIDCDLVIARVPSIVAYRVAEIGLKMKKAIFSVAIGCAWDAYWNHSIKGKLIAPYMFFKMKKIIRMSNYVLYVTNEFLQCRYPCTCKSIGVSDVMITEFDDEIIENRKRKIHSMNKKEVTIMTSGSVGTRIKGQEYMIKAIPLLNRKGITVKYLLAGADSPDYLKRIVSKCNVNDQVEFLGMLSSAEVFHNLDKVDIYIQPSLQEGLPRAVVEAMSRGCPVIGARTGGIPELISSKYIAKRKSSKELAKTILLLLQGDNIKLEAEHNFLKAKEYNEKVLANRRNDYYKYIIESENRG